MFFTAWQLHLTEIRDREKTSVSLEFSRTRYDVHGLLAVSISHYFDPWCSAAPQPVVGGEVSVLQHGSQRSRLEHQFLLMVVSSPCNISIQEHFEYGLGHGFVKFKGTNLKRNKAKILLPQST